MPLEIAKINTDVEMLPHERAWLDSEYNRLCEIQGNLGEMLGSSMLEGAETFHDNAPMEVIRDEQNHNIFPYAMRIMRMARNSVIRPYPDVNEQSIVPGTTVDLLWPGETKDETFAIVYLGFAGVYKESAVQPVSREADLGKLLLGSKSGDVTGEINGREITVHVSRIDQVLMRDHFSKVYDLSRYPVTTS